MIFGNFLRSFVHLRMQASLICTCSAPFRQNEREKFCHGSKNSCYAYLTLHLVLKWYFYICPLSEIRRGLYNKRSLRYGIRIRPIHVDSLEAYHPKNDFTIDHKRVSAIILLKKHF